MADDSDDPDKAAERLEAALERIAQLSAERAAAMIAAAAQKDVPLSPPVLAGVPDAAPPDDLPDDELPPDGSRRPGATDPGLLGAGGDGSAPAEAEDEDLTADVAARLDGLIARLRAALGTNAD